MGGGGSTFSPTMSGGGGGGGGFAGSEISFGGAGGNAGSGEANDLKSLVWLNIGATGATDSRIPKVMSCWVEWSGVGWEAEWSGMCFMTLVVLAAVRQKRTGWKGGLRRSFAEFFVGWF